MELKFPLVEDLPFMSHPDFVTCESQLKNWAWKLHGSNGATDSCWGKTKRNLQRKQLSHRSASCQRRCLCCPSSHLSSHVSLFYVVMISASKALGESSDNLIINRNQIFVKECLNRVFKCSWCISENSEILSAEKVAASVVSCRVQKDLSPKCFWSEMNTTMNHWSTMFVFEYSWLSAVFTIFFIVCDWGMVGLVFYNF